MPGFEGALTDDGDVITAPTPRDADATGSAAKTTPSQ